jgi:hypothetical protein
MKKILLAAFLIVIILVACQKKSNPASPGPSGTATITPTITQTATITTTYTVSPTATNTPHVFVVDNFNDGDLSNGHGDYWYGYWPFGACWVSTPEITTGYSGYGLKVTGIAESYGGSPGAYYGYFGTSTNLGDLDIRPVNYLNFMARLVTNVPAGNAGTFSGIQIVMMTSSYSSYGSYVITPAPGASWQAFKMDLSLLTMGSGTLDGLMSSLNGLIIGAYYSSPVQHELAQAELYVDEVYFSEY